MVNLGVIARRAGVSREAVRLWATAQRGPGGFPKPTLISSGGEQLWDWLEVASWLEQYKESAPSRGAQLKEIEAAFASLAEARMRLAMARTCRTADRVLAARDALMSEPDEAVRQEFERLLEDA
jgi:hypothetical protein